MLPFDYIDVLVYGAQTAVTVAAEGEAEPRLCSADILLLDDDDLFFMAEASEKLASRLQTTKRMVLTGVRNSPDGKCQTVSVSGEVVPVGPPRLYELLDENPYLLEPSARAVSLASQTLFCMRGATPRR